MSKKRKKASGHTVAPQFPNQGSPMDMANHPLNNLPDPTMGLSNPAAGAGMAM